MKGRSDSFKKMKEDQQSRPTHFPDAEAVLVILGLVSCTTQWPK